MKRWSSSLFLSLTLALFASACGYHAVNDSAGRANTEHFTVVLASSNIPDAVASDEVLAGVRDELSKAGALKSGDAYPRCEIEVLRADEASEGIGAVANTDGVLIPNARATTVGVVARAWIVRSRDGQRERDTGDVRAMETVSVAVDARAATFRHTDAMRAASRRTGRRLGSRILGLPTSSD